MTDQRDPSPGSSPRARGTHERRLSDRFRRRFIPACAGNASPSRPRTSPTTVHPRVRGERDAAVAGHRFPTGSSPRARGTQPGMHPDGDGLYLQVRGGSKSWIYRYGVGGRTRYLGLGAYPETSLAGARKARDSAREKVRAGGDPIADKRPAANEAPTAMTFRQAVGYFISCRATRGIRAAAGSSSCQAGAGTLYFRPEGTRTVMHFEQLCGIADRNGAARWAAVSVPPPGGPRGWSLPAIGVHRHRFVASCLRGEQCDEASSPGIGNAAPPPRAAPLPNPGEAWQAGDSPEKMPPSGRRTS